MALRGGLVLLLGVCLMFFQGSKGQESTTSPGQDELSKHASAARLYVNLLRLYHPLVIPTTPVNVKYGLTIHQIDGVDEAENLLRISAFASVIWSDHRFKWDPSVFNGIKFVSVPPNKIWTPDLRPYAQVLEAEEVNVRIYNDGTMYHFIPLRLAIPCFLQFANYPFDSHTCSLKVESWGYDMVLLNLTQLEGSPGDGSLNGVKAHTLWDIQSFNVTRNITKYACCDEAYVSLTFSFKIKRQLTGYTTRVLAPSVVTSLLILVCFLIPPTSGERILLCSVLLLCVLLQLFHLNLSVPLSGADSPFLGDFLCFSVFLAFFAAIESVLSFNLSRGIWGDGNNDPRHEGGGEFPGVQTKSNTAMGRIARIIDIGCFVIFTFIFAVAGGIILNPHTE